MSEEHHRRRSTYGGILLGTIISALFLALSSIGLYVILDLRERVKDAEKQMDQNSIYVRTWDAEIESRRADIRDLEAFFPSQEHPAPNPPSINPTIPPPQHD